MKVSEVPYRTGPSRVLLRLVAAGLAAIAVAAGVGTETASAATLNYKGGTKVDILLNGSETRQAASGFFGAAAVCGSAKLLAASRGGMIAAVITNLAWLAICPRIVFNAASAAVVRGKWAGITVNLVPFWYWTWTY